MLDFSEVKDRNSDQSKFRRTEFLKLSPGNHIVRIIDEKISGIDAHFLLGKYLVECLGEECPICQNNRKIILEHPEDFRSIKGYYSRQTRYFMNVLDRTPTKICPQCNAVIEAGENGFPATCPSCNTFVNEVKPQKLEQIKLLSCGVTLCNQLSSLQKAVLDDDGNPYGLNKFDLNLVVSGTGKNKTITPVPSNLTKIGELDLEGKELYDHKTGVISLLPGEIIELLKGVSLKDIYTARNLKKGSAEELADELSDDIKKTVEELFED